MVPFGLVGAPEPGTQPLRTVNEALV